MEDEFRWRIKSKIGMLKYERILASEDLSANEKDYNSKEVDDPVKTIDCTKYAIEVLESILRKE